MKVLRFLPLLALLLVGCNKSEPIADKSAPPNADKPFKVALLTPGPISDAGWSALAYDGLMAIKSELGAEVNNQEAKGTQIKDEMRRYAQDGYSLVIGHGFEYNEPGVEVAKDFPNTIFVSSSGGKTAPNAGAFRFHLEEGFYLAGVMAASMTKTGVTAMIGGDDVPSIRATFAAYKAGFLSVRPTGNVIEVFTGNGEDVAAAKQATLNAIAQHADFVIHQANAAAQGVFDACKERGVYAFGANSDQNSNESGVVIASAVIVAKPAFLELAKEVKNHTYKGAVTMMGMKDGAISFVTNPAMKAKIPADVLAKLNLVEDHIKSGDTKVPTPDF